jgi:Right handed beta helix region
MRNIALALLLTIVLQQSTTGADYYVRTSGDNKNNGRSAKSAFQTLDYALTQCTSNNDRIYVGGGVHTVNASRTMPKNQRLEIVGDLTGKKTGDAGRPVLIGKANAWSLVLYSGQSVSISGVQFLGDTVANHYGLHVSSLTNEAELYDCVFTDLYLASDLYNNSKCSIEACQYQTVKHIGLFVRTSQCDIQDCTFNNTAYAVYCQDLKNSSISKCAFSANNGTSQLAVYLNNSSTKVDKVNISGYNSAIYSLSTLSLKVENTRISDFTSWGIYGNGKSCDVSDVTITGKSKSAGYGISFANTGGSDPDLQQVTIENVYCGIRSENSTKYRFKNVSSTKSYLGYYAYNFSDLRLDNVRKGGLYLDDNTIGLHATSDAKNPGRFTLQNAEVNNNDYGLYTNGSSVQLEGCKFNKNSRAVYVVSSPETTVSKCDVLDNNTRNTWSHWGLRIDANKTSVANCEILRNDYGLYLTNLGSELPKLSNLNIQDNKDYGLLVSGGQLKLDGSTTVKVSGSHIGLWGNNCAMTIESWACPKTSNYPYYLFGGSLDMTGCDIAAGVIGVYAHTLKSVSFKKCTIRDQSNHGLYVHLPGNLLVESCSIDAAKSHALYCYNVSAPAESISVNNLTVSNSVIAARFIGVPVNSKNVKNLVLTNNNNGLRVEQAELELTPEMNLIANGNQYAVMSYSGKLVSNGFSSANNVTALYAYRSSTELKNTSLSASSYGALLYGSPVQATGLSVSTASNGLYHDPQDQHGCTLSIADSEFKSISSIGIRAVGQVNSKDVVLKNVSISGGNYGLYFSSNKVQAEDIQFNELKAYAVYANESDSQLNRLTINKTNSWGIYGVGGSMRISNSRLYGSHGILLSTLTSTVVNTIVSGSTYGVYSNRKDGQYSVVNSTIAGVRYDGVLANLGKVEVFNTIIQSGRYGINDASGTNSSHDYNLISAVTPFRNTTARKNELTKTPLFVNATAGDYRLQAGSPAINAGRDLSAVSKSDIVGAARGSFGKFEIGAYEYLDKEGSLRIVDWDETAD